MRSILAAFSIVLAIGFNTSFAVDSCDVELMSTEEMYKTLMRVAKAKTPPEVTGATVDYHYLIGKKLAPEVVQVIESVLPKDQVYRILLDEEMPVFIRNMSFALAQIKAANLTADNALTEIKTILKNNLKGKVPENTIESRVENFIASRTQENMRRMMGDMTFEETKIFLHGPDYLHPSAESNLGKYIAESGAQTRVIRFPKGLNPDGELGPERLVVAISAETMPLFKKYMAGENGIFHFHTQRQGTLYLSFNGKYGSYGQHGSEIPFTQGTTLPMLVLKTTEGQRAANFFEVAAQTGKVRLPWVLPAKSKQSFKEYCATGGYTSCTHWFGNIPIGDKKVTEYKFPGKVDQYASNSVNADPVIDAKPRVQTLMAIDYEAAKEIKGLHKVFKAPGHMQLWETVGLETQQFAGELANPGYVLLSLTGHASTDRVPVVFVMVEDHRIEIPANYNTNHSAY